MKKISIIPNNGKDLGLLNTKRIIELLSGRAEVYMEKSYSVAEMNVNYVEEAELYDNAEVMIILGGDGTILLAAEKCAKMGIPVLGINLGKIGFMTEIERDGIEDAIDKLLADDYKIEKRMLLKLEIHKGNGVVSCRHALNDVVVSKTSGAKLIGIELFADNELVNRYIADGLIIATPTGSTGYSISAGGPVVDPLMQLYIATPICAHMLSVRSAVLSAEKEIVIKLDGTYPDNEAVISADGDMEGFIGLADEIHITKSKYQFKLIKIGSQSFYDTLISKLS